MSQEPWVEVWRLHVAPHLTDAGLLALRDALADGRPRLLRNHTCWPLPVSKNGDKPCERGCPITVGATEGNLGTVDEAEEAFFRFVNGSRDSDGLSYVRPFVWAWDDGTIRCEDLLAEVNACLILRDPEFAA